MSEAIERLNLEKGEYHESQGFRQFSGTISRHGQCVETQRNAQFSTPARHKSDTGLRGTPLMARRLASFRQAEQPRLEVSGSDPEHEGQVLDGAKAIAAYLVYLGLTNMHEKKVFQWAADGRLPVRKIGNRLVANKRALLRHFGLSEH
jgi:hypothetical protein